MLGIFHFYACLRGVARGDGQILLAKCRSSTRFAVSSRGFTFQIFIFHWVVVGQNLQIVARTQVWETLQIALFPRENALLPNFDNIWSLLQMWSKGGKCVFYRGKIAFC